MPSSLSRVDMEVSISEALFPSLHSPSQLKEQSPSNSLKI